MRAVRLARFAALLAVLAFAIALAVTRGRWFGANPDLVAAHGAAMVAASLAALGVAVWRLVRERSGRIARGAEGILFLGIVLTAAAGFGRWAFGMQGVAVLTTGEQVSLEGGRTLQAAWYGPLARREALAGTVRLLEVDLKSGGAGGYQAVSRVAIGGVGGEPRAVEIAPSRPAVHGGLELFQGAFGFAPRLVISRGGRVAFDGTVHFISRRVGEQGVAFEAELELPAEGLRVVSAVELSGLDGRMKGHPALELEVHRGEALLGRGRLQPGRSAALAEGWEILFAGMRMWSEIDVRNRERRAPLRIGILLALAGAIGWPIAAWRRW